MSQCVLLWNMPTLFGEYIQALSDHTGRIHSFCLWIDQPLRNLLNNFSLHSLKELFPLVGVHLDLPFLQNLFNDSILPRLVIVRLFVCSPFRLFASSPTSLRSV